jgi:hypothetical protein
VIVDTDKDTIEVFCHICGKERGIIRILGRGIIDYPLFWSVKFAAGNSIFLFCPKCISK